MNRVTLQSAFVLHTRPYSNTSLIVELFTQDHGRISVLARSARGLKSRYKGKLQLFSPLILGWSGRSELKNLGNLEIDGVPYQLDGKALLCGFYLNELVLRLLHREDPYPKLFETYHLTLRRLSFDEALEPTLRVFEKQLLERLGYGLSLTRELQSGTQIESEAHYQYIPERGFMRCELGTDSTHVFSGSSLLALHREQLSDSQSLQDAKRLMRLLLSQHLGSKPLKSRELLV